MPIFLWYTDFFRRVGDELGLLVEVASRTLEHLDLREAWIKVDKRDSGVILLIM